MNNAIVVQNLKKGFRSGDKKIEAVNGVSFTLERGIFASMIGKSGSGKSTLLNLLGALDRADAGQIEIDGTDITKLRNRKLDEYRRKTIGFVFQFYNLIPNLSALENVMLPMEFTGVPQKERREHAKALLTSVGIDELRQKHHPAKLSGGEQRRVAIARSLANRPTIILADEPTGNLDTETGEKIIGLLKKLAKQEDTTVLVTTHDAEIAKESERVFHLQDGKLVSK